MTQQEDKQEAQAARLREHAARLWMVEQNQLELRQFLVEVLRSLSRIEDALGITKGINLPVDQVPGLLCGGGAREE